MRGSPPVHLVLFVVGFALLAIPLAQLTFARPVQTIAAQLTVPSTTTPTLIRLKFAHAPKAVSLKESNGTDLLKRFDGPVPAQFEARSEMHIPQEGVELNLEVTWPEGTPDTAVTVELEPDEKDARSQTRWSNGPSMSELLSYEWKP